MSDMDSEPKIEILLVEDNPGDIVLFMESLEESHQRANLNSVEDGEEAISFLNQQGHYKYAPRPHLIILDLNLPKLNGREVLEGIRKNAAFDTIPIIVLTTSKSDKDMCEAYRLHANCYIVKPVDLKQFMTVLKEIIHFWLNVTYLPMDR